MSDDAENTIESNSKQSWWKQRTKIERGGMISMAIIVLILIGLILALALVLSHQAIKEASSRPRRSLTSNMVRHRPIYYQRTPKINLPSPHETNHTVCVTQGCVHAAENVLKFIDESVNPCDDFYQFACGHFLEEATIPADKAEVSSFTMLNSMVQDQLKAILEETPKNREPKPFGLLRTLYNVCMNTSAIEDKNLTFVKFILKDLGGWPILEGKDWDEDQFDWKLLLYRLRYHGLNINNFFSFHVIPDPKNSSRRIINLDQVELQIGRDNLLEGFNDVIVKTYYDYMVDLAVIFGADREFAKEEVKKMVEFKIKLANITTPEFSRRNDTAMYHLMTIRELQRRYSSISWVSLINGIIALKIKQVTHSDKVIVSELQYFSDLEKLLKNSSKRAQANYLMFQAIGELEPYLPERIRNREQHFKNLVYGTSAQPERWVECVAVASGSMNLAAGALYVRKYFHKDVKENAKKMVEDIRNELIAVLEHIDWMDNTTREQAIEKALVMVPHIAYPDEYLDDKNIEQYYSGLRFPTDNYVHIRNQISKFKTDKDFGKLWKPVNKSDWSTRIPPITLNAGYAPNENSIQLPAAILQGIFFNKDRPNYMNYAAIGSVIGHEITHGFDDQGKQYDKDGNLINWWAEGTDEAFKNKANCIIEQYRGYIVPEIGIHLNGINTQGENIADNGGTKQAYLAYNAWVKRHGSEATLPGLNYTTRQMFWISAANLWCTKERDESLESSILTDSHSPGRYRVIVPFSNSEYFANDFNCPVGSNMNPKDKCQIW